MLQLYYALGSPPSRAVLQTIRVLRLEVEVKNIDVVKREQMSPEYLKINPMHQVPALVDGDFILTESRAIMAYLVNSKAPGSSWYPNDAKTQALIDKLLYFDAINFFELAASILVRRLMRLNWWVDMSCLFFHKRPVFFTGKTDIPIEKITKLKETLRLFESFLEGKQYFTGNHPTIVDISILSTFIMFQATFVNYGEIPNVTAWYQRCHSLPGFEENLAGKKGIQDLMAAKGMAPISLQWIDWLCKHYFSHGNK